MSLMTDIPKYVAQAHGGRRVNPEYLALMEPYLDEGMHAKAVSEIFGVSTDTVLRHFPGRGWTLKQARELGTTMKHFNEKMRRLKV